MRSSVVGSTIGTTCGTNGTNGCNGTTRGDAARGTCDIGGTSGGTIGITSGGTIGTTTGAIAGTGGNSLGGKRTSGRRGGIRTSPQSTMKGGSAVILSRGIVRFFR